MHRFLHRTIKLYQKFIFCNNEGLPGLRLECALLVNSEADTPVLSPVIFPIHLFLLFIPVYLPFPRVYFVFGHPRPPHSRILGPLGEYSYFLTSAVLTPFSS